MNNNKTNINWLACIYGNYHLNSIKWEFLRNEILQVLLKKKEKI